MVQGRGLRGIGSSETGSPPCSSRAQSAQHRDTTLPAHHELPELLTLEVSLLCDKCPPVTVGSETQIVRVNLPWRADDRKTGVTIRRASPPRPPRPCP